MFTSDVAPDGAEPYRITATSRDVAHWERTGKGRSLGAIERDARMSQLEEIAHLAAVRQGRFVGDLESFRATCDITPIDMAKEAREAAERDDEDDDLDDDDDGSGPTRPAR